MNTPMISEFASILNGRERRKELTAREEALAKKLGYIVMFIDDDVDWHVDPPTGECWCKLRGAIHGDVVVDEHQAKCFNEGIYIVAGQVFKANDSCEYSDCPFYLAARDKINRIRLRYSSCADSWWFETDIPHEEFKILPEDVTYDDDLFCRGIVIEVSTLK